MASVKQCDQCHQSPSGRVATYQIDPGDQVRTVDLCADCADFVTLADAFELGRVAGKGYARGSEVLDALPMDNPPES